MGEATENREAVERVVQDHGRWVFCAARRRVRDAGLAEDVAQGVFLMYWRKGAGGEPKREGESGRGREGGEEEERDTGTPRGEDGDLAGWLYRAVRYCSANALRLQRIRQRHEREAAMEKKRSEGTAGWMEVEEELEGAVDGLSEKDRQVVVLRFYRGLSLSEVGMAMGINERAAQKRVERAVGKLREKLAGKGVEVEAGSLGAMVLAHAVESGMEGGAAGLVEKVMAGIGDGAGNGTAGLIAKGAEKMMVWAKVKVAAVVTGVVLIAGVAAIPVMRGGAATAETKVDTAAPPAAEVVTIDQEVKDLIPLVRAGEARLLGDIDFAYTEQFRTGIQPKDPQAITSRDQKIVRVRGVVQGRRSYSDAEVIIGPADRISRRRTFRSYDGQFTRTYTLFDQGGEAVEWAITDELMYDPWTRSLPAPFLVFAMNSSSMSQVLRAGVPSMPGARQHFRRLGDDEYLGQKCVTVQATIDDYKPEALATPDAIVGTMTMTWWLGPQSGYLPLKMTGGAKTRNGSSVGITMESANPKEVATGLILPMRINAMVAEPDGGIQREFVFESLSLSPVYPPEKFVVAPPPGATLNVLHSGKTLAKATMDAQWTPAAAEALLHAAMKKDVATTQPSKQ